jgi:hypothetical protein
MGHEPKLGCEVRAATKVGAEPLVGSTVGSGALRFLAIYFPLSWNRRGCGRLGSISPIGAPGTCQPGGLCCAPDPGARPGQGLFAAGFLKKGPEAVTLANWARPYASLDLSESGDGTTTVVLRLCGFPLGEPTSAFRARPIAR